MDAAQALPLGALTQLYSLDIGSVEFERAQRRTPARHYALGLDDAYSMFVCSTPGAESRAFARVERRDVNEFAAACTCGAGAEHLLCWHVVAAWRVAAIMNDWPERHRPRWQWLYECALEQGRYADAVRFRRKLIESGGLVSPSNAGAAIDAPQAMRAAA